MGAAARWDRRGGQRDASGLGRHAWAARFVARLSPPLRRLLRTPSRAPTRSCGSAARRRRRCVGAILVRSRRRRPPTCFRGVQESDEDRRGPGPRSTYSARYDRRLRGLSVRGAGAAGRRVLAVTRGGRRCPALRVVTRAVTCKVLLLATASLEIVLTDRVARTLEARCRDHSQARRRCVADAELDGERLADVGYVQRVGDRRTRRCGGRRPVLLSLRSVLSKARRERWAGARAAQEAVAGRSGSGVGASGVLVDGWPGTSTCVRVSSRLGWGCMACPDRPTRWRH